MDTIESKLNVGDRHVETIFNKLEYIVILRQCVSKNRQIATWASYAEVVLMLYCYNINIEMLSNLAAGVITSNTYVLLNYMWTPSTPALYLYYHAYTRHRIT